MPQSASRFLQINGLLLGLFLIGLAVDRLVGVAFLRWIFALPILFFLPGWNTSFLLLARSSLLERILFALTVSFPAVGALVYGSHLLLRYPMHSPFVHAVVGAVVGASTLLGIFGIHHHTIKDEHISARDLRPLFWVLGIFVALSVAIFFLYPFIPESDPYYFIVLVKETMKTGELFRPGYRPLFISFMSTLSFLGNLPLGIIFKVIIPLLGAMIFLPTFLSARRLFKERWLNFLVTALPLSAPVIMLESVMVRPQLAVLFTLPAILYFLIKALRERDVWIGVGMVAASGLLVGFHELALLILLSSLLVLGVILWPQIRNNPKTSISIAVLAALAAYPYLKGSSIVGALANVGSIIGERIASAPPRLWFISNYTNIEGTPVGWPGWSWILYYAYHIGPLIPLLVLLSIVWRKAITYAQLWPVWVTLVFFLLMAEVLPRFHVAYYPDRAWPFIVLSFALLAPSIFARRPLFRRDQWLRLGSIVLLVIGISGALYVAYRKQGWVTRAEFQAAEYLKNHTPADSVVISQTGNGPLISYYSDRIFLAHDVFAPTLTPRDVLAIVQDVPELLTNISKYRRAKEDALSKLANALDTLQGADTATADQAAKDIREDLVILLASIKAIEQIEKSGLIGERPVYILYSYDKFGGLYASRAWWQAYNFANADLTKFDNSEFFEKTYDNGKVFVWHVNE